MALKMQVDCFSLVDDAENDEKILANLKYTLKTAEDQQICVLYLHDAHILFRHGRQNASERGSSDKASGPQSGDDCWDCKQADDLQT